MSGDDDYWTNPVNAEWMGHLGPRSWYRSQDCRRVHVGVNHRDWALTWTPDQKRQLLMLRGEV